MLKLRNAVLTALLAFCLAMPFVSCSFNDGATGDVSNLVKEQPGNNQNGGNGGSTGGNEKPSGGDEDSGDNGNENPSGGDNGGNENPSGGNNGGSGNENPSGGNEKPGEGTVYTVKYGDTVIAPDMPESALSHFVQTYGLVEDTDYTIRENVITLTDSGYNKVTSEMPGEGDEPVPDVPVPDVPVPDVPVPDVPGDVEGTVYTVKYGDTVIVPDMPESALSDFAQTYGLVKDTDYTIDGTLTDSGFNKLPAAGSGAGEEGYIE